MIGPLTNLALALRLDPRHHRRGSARSSSWAARSMGAKGSTAHAEVAEFNIYADPEAGTSGADRRRRDDRRAVGSVGVAHYMDGTRVDALSHAGTGLAAAGFLPGACRALSRHPASRNGNPDRMLYVDPLAAAVVVDLVDRHEIGDRASSSVALAPGLTRGMTLVDPSASARYAKNNVRRGGRSC